MFNEDYLVQILVADRNDTYYLNSGLQLNLDKRICLDLPKEFKRVYFIRKSGDGINIYNKFGEEEESFRKKWALGSKGKIVPDKIIKCLDQNKHGEKTAIIAELPAFSELMAENVGDLIKQSKISNKGMLILTLSENIDKEMDSFVGDKSILLENESGCLCQELQYLKQNGEEIFRNMKKNSPRTTFMNEITVESCKGILINAQLEQTETFLTSKELTNCAVFLQRLCVCEKLRKDQNFLTALSANPKFKEIFDLISQKRYFETLYKKTCKLLDGAENTDLERKLDLLGYEKEAPLIKRDDPLVLKICSLCYPPKWYKGEVDSDICERLSEAQKCIYYPAAGEHSEQVKKWINDTLLRECEEAEALSAKCGDIRYLNDTLVALWFAVKKLYIGAAKEETAEELKKELQAWLDASKFIVSRKYDLVNNKTDPQTVKLDLAALVEIKGIYEKMSRKLKETVNTSELVSELYSYIREFEEEKTKQQAQKEPQPEPPQKEERIQSKSTADIRRDRQKYKD